MTIQRFLVLAALAFAAALLLAGCADTQLGQQCVNGTFCPVGAQCSGDGTTCIFGGCGNAKRDPGEECDDGNVNPGDGCSMACTIEACGNGIKDHGEICDDGNVVDGDKCAQDCMSDETCGNGTLDSTVEEICDDGNVTSGDGCDSNCKPTGCGNGIVTTSTDPVKN